LVRRFPKMMPYRKSQSLNGCIPAFLLLRRRAEETADSAAGAAILSPKRTLSQ